MRVGGPADGNAHARCLCMVSRLPHVKGSLENQVDQCEASSLVVCLGDTPLGGGRLDGAWACVYVILGFARVAKSQWVRCGLQVCTVRCTVNGQTSNLPMQKPRDAMDLIRSKHKLWAENPINRKRFVNSGFPLVSRHCPVLLTLLSNASLKRRSQWL